MPRIAVAMGVVAAMAFSIGFNTTRYTVVWEMVGGDPSLTPSVCSMQPGVAPPSEAALSASTTAETALSPPPGASDSSQVAASPTPNGPLMATINEPPSAAVAATAAPEAGAAESTAEVAIEDGESGITATAEALTVMDRPEHATAADDTLPTAATAKEILPTAATDDDSHPTAASVEVLAAERIDDPETATIDDQATGMDIPTPEMIAEAASAQQAIEVSAPDTATLATSSGVAPNAMAADGSLEPPRVSPWSLRRLPAIDREVAASDNR